MPPASTYNPGTGMFHVLNSSPFESMASNPSSGRFRSIEDSSDFGSVLGSGSEYDSISKNGSCSGESEDQSQSLDGKEKKEHPPGVVGGGSDKRDKIRNRNKKKHQRQKERRVQELRDRCMGYLMSRKLEALAQQLIAMGFSPDRATMALILNKGHVEDSVAWLLEGGEGQVKNAWNGDASLKIDISEELARIADLENRFHYLRVEIERAVVAFEGNLDKAAQWLHERHAHVGHGDPDYGSRMQDRGEERTSIAGSSPYLMSVQGRSIDLFRTLNQQKVEEEEHRTAHNRSREYQSLLSGSSGNVDSIPRSKPQSGIDFQKLSSSSVIGKGANTAVKNPSQPTPLAHLGLHGLESRAPPHDNGYSFSGREQGMHLTARDSSVATQLIQSPISPPSNGKSPSVSPFPSPSSWNGSAAGASSPSSVLFFNGIAGDLLFKGAPNSKPKVGVHSKHADELGKAHQPLPENLPNSMAPPWGNGSASSGPSTSVPAPPSHQRTQSAPRFLSGWGSGLPGGLADRSIWVSTGSDGDVIDWSSASPPNLSESSAWGGPSSFSSILNLSEGGNPGRGFSGDGRSQEHRRDPKLEAGSSTIHQSWNRSNSGISRGQGLQEKLVTDAEVAPGRAVPEWTSPFAGKDLFSLLH